MMASEMWCAAAGAVWQVSGLLPLPWDLRITNANTSEQLVAQCGLLSVLLRAPTVTCTQCCSLHVSRQAGVYTYISIIAGVPSQRLCSPARSTQRPCSSAPQPLLCTQARCGLLLMSLVGQVLLYLAHATAALQTAPPTRLRCCPAFICSPAACCSSSPKQCPQRRAPPASRALRLQGPASGT